MTICTWSLITPTIDLNSALAAACVDKIAAWNDGMGAEWRSELPAAVKSADRIAIEPNQMPQWSAHNWMI